MADVDIVIDIYHSVSTSTAIGTKSPYATTPHPGTGKKIEGWKWDQRTWPTDVELKATDFAPTVYDPATNFVPEDKFQSGIGDNKDLKLEKLYEEVASNTRYWTPRINHGYFYIHDQQWYLYSDDAVRVLMDATVTSGVLQYKDLEFAPKPTIPISVRRYKWNREKSRYEIDLDFRKKLNFTGIVTDGEEAETSVDGYYQLASIDASKPEMIVEYSSGVNRVVLNANWEEQVGTSGNLASLEFLGVADGLTNEFHIPYAPVSPSGLVQLITWDERVSPTVTYSWSRIDQTDDFTPGPYQQFKLDEHLGIITFGNYDELTGSGAGRLPGAMHQVGLVYTRGAELIYEPEFTRDWIEPRPGDVNPFHNAINQGFLKVTTQTANPQWIQLTAENITGDATNGYEMDLGNKTAKIVAKVISNEGTELEGEIVTFEILGPEFGTFSNEELTTQSITNSLGEANTPYVPPSSIDEIGQATVSVSHNGSDTFISATNLVAPSKKEDVYLYKVLTTDPVLGILDSEVPEYYDTYFSDEGISEDPSGIGSTQLFEEGFRERNNLLEPATYDANDLSTGAKTIVFDDGGEPGVIDPNYGVQAADDPDYLNGLTHAPLIPHSMVTTGSDENPSLELTYSGLLQLVDLDEFKAYFVVCPVTTRLRARVTNPISGKTVFSNVIQITINIPESAEGVEVIQSSTEMTSDLLQKTKHINEVPDAEILTHSGELWGEYLEDRVYLTEIDKPVPWDSDSNTIGYWPMESGSRRDWSTFGNHLDNKPSDAQGMISAQGFIGQGFRSTTPGSPQWLDAPNLYTDLSLYSGTIDFLFRSDTDTPSGQTFKLFEFTVTGYDGRKNQLQGQVQNMANSGIWFRFDYGIDMSATMSHQAYLMHNLLDSGIYITDSEWHSVRVSWGYNWTEQTITLAGQVDKQIMSGGNPTGFLGKEPSGLLSPLSGGKVQAVVGDLTGSGSFYFDEVRYSNAVRDDDWPPIETVVSGESFIDWFRRSRKADSARISLQNMTFSGYVPARLPHGFRLKSPGITVASMLDRATFTSLSDHLPDDYYDDIEE